MRVYLGIDDTDVRDWPMGTGKLVRTLVAHALPPECACVGVVRHQLPRDPDISYTSNNSSACAVLAVDANASLDKLATHAAAFVTAHAPHGSDPGLCLAGKDDVCDGLLDFARNCTGQTMTQRQAMDAARGLTLLGLGGTNDGIIGAAAAVGLTHHGWCGRFIEYGALRSLRGPLRIADLTATGIRVVSVDRDPMVPLDGDTLETPAWIRPSLWGGHPVLQVVRAEPGIWRTAHSKRAKRSAGTSSSAA